MPEDRPRELMPLHREDALRQVRPLSLPSLDTYDDEERDWVCFFRERVSR
jgi:hypothetical protein